MRIPVTAVFVLSIVLTLAAPELPAQQRPTDVSLRVGSPAGVIRLDGVLDEPVWGSAPAIEGLTMVEPVEGGRVTGTTRVMVLATARELVIGVECRDPDAAAIVSYSRERDADLAAEDHVKLLFDTFLAGRSGYVFAVNASGARYDALVTGDGKGENKDWDAAWESAVARGPGGWAAEIRIPIRSLAFRDGAREWGFNVERRIQRALETSRWASPLRDARISQPSRAGRLAGLPVFTLGIGLSIRPALTTGIERTTRVGAQNGFVEPSLDLSERLGANLLASVTANTDFAETEVDARRSNLTRFPLFFPEKRTFFLEGADNFDFGVHGGHERDFLPFFTRRIGLHQGLEVPLVAGGKVNGRVRGTSFAALAVRSGDAAGLPPTSLGAMRVRQDVLEESLVGLIATSGDPQGRTGAWTLGSDVAFRTSRLGGRRNLVLSAWALATGRDSLGGDRGAWGAAIEYPNDILNGGIYVRHVGDGFDPSLGFVPRPGVTSLQAALNVRHRQPLPRLRELFYQLDVQTVLDRERRWESYSVFTAPLYMRFESGDVFEFNVMPLGERLPAPFEIAPGVLIPAGTYRWVRYRLEATAAAKRNVSGRLTWWFGTFYDGRLHQVTATVAIKPSPAVTVDATLDRNVGHLPAGDFTQEVVRGRVRLGLSPDLQLISLLQYDNASRLLGVNTRLRWQFHWLGELFVVYNHNVTDLSARWTSDSYQLMTKMQYAIRL